MFYGIIIQMFYPPDEHLPPHFHAFYAEHEAQIKIENGEIMAGGLPNRQMKLVLAWTELHKEDLLADWRIVMNGEKPFAIEPLR